MSSFINRFFDIKGHGSSVKTEIVAGITTFLTMAYIAFVNPGILKAAGMPFGAVMVATCLAAAGASILMGMYANLPVALAPGMGTNAYFAFFVCGAMGVAWPTALGAVFLSGIGFFLLTITGLRKRIIDAIPDSMKHAIAAGIGLFIAFVGLKEAGVIVKNDAVLVGLGNLANPAPAITIAGIAITGVFLIKRIKGALLWGILITTIIAIAAGVTHPPKAIFSLPPSIAPTFAKLDIKGALGLGLLQIMFAFLFVDMFDTIATLIGVADEGGLMKKSSDGKLRLPGMNRALLTDSIATMGGAILGTSTTTSYVESASGIAAGGKTGLTSIVTGIMFLTLLFLSPIIGIVPPQATAPALVIVCVFMLRNLAKIKWDNYAESIPSAVICIAIPLTFSISNGLALGFILYPILKLLTGKGRDVDPIAYALSILFIAKFIFLGTK